MRSNVIAEHQVEAQLIARAKVGDERAFEALFHAYERRIYLLCARMTGDPNEAEDLTQETFLQMFRKIATFRHESAFATWLHRVAVNVVLMHLRRKRVQLVPFERPDVPQEEPRSREYGTEDRALVGLIDRILIRRAIGQLPDGRRAVLVLHDMEGYRHTEIAQLQDCSIGNSKSQLSRARYNMRKLLQYTREGPSLGGTTANDTNAPCHPSRRAAKGEERPCEFMESRA